MAALETELKRTCVKRAKPQGDLIVSLGVLWELCARYSLELFIRVIAR
jgi:hypothetical protein